MKREMGKTFRLALAGLWLLLTLSLSAWWMIHGMRQAELVSRQENRGGEAGRQQRMLFWEGSFLLAIVTAGGAALTYLIYKDQRQYEEVKRFFSTFTHELKTSLTSLRLQAEILEEDPRNRENENLRRLLRDVVRLELQLENALILAQAEKGRLFLEEIPLKKTLQQLSVHWPQLEVAVSRDARLKADQRALECIFRNLLQNASVHGNASRVEVEARPAESGVELVLKDNGKGFPGVPAELGKMFVRHTTRSGSGLGLHLARLLTERMHGSIRFEKGRPGGLEVHMKLGGRVV